MTLSLSQRFDRFADRCEGTAPLYETLARSVVDDPQLLDLASIAPDFATAPHLLFGAVHYLLLRGNDHDLGHFYPTVTDEPAAGDPTDDFRSFCREHQAIIRELMATRRTRTSSVRRCAALLPALETVSRLADDRPLSLVEVGASGGLNLRFDRYRYRYDREDDDPIHLGSPDAPVCIDTAVAGERDPPICESFPCVADRVGVDTEPLDVADEADLTWLRALVWPERGDCHELLADAAECVRRDPPRLVEGDAAERLPELVAELPAGPVCVFDTRARHRLDDDRKEAYEAALAAAAADRELYAVSGDGVATDRGRGLTLSLARFDGEGDDGTVDPELLAYYERDGRWVEWLA